MKADDCFVCRKHRERGALLPGGPVAEDDLVLVSHIVTADTLGREAAQLPTWVTCSSSREGTRLAD